MINCSPCADPPSPNAQARTFGCGDESSLNRMVSGPLICVVNETVNPSPNSQLLQFHIRHSFN